MSETVLHHRRGGLGAGRMGTALALRLLAAGCDLTVYNRTKAKTEPLADRGAAVAGAPADLGAADIVFITVGGSDDLIDVVLGPHGLISGPSAPAVVVDCSTVSADASEQVREQLAERGSALLAAPGMGNAKVAGGGPGAPGRARAGADVPAGPALPGPARHGRDLRGRGRDRADRQAVPQPAAG